MWLAGIPVIFQRPHIVPCTALRADKLPAANAVQGDCERVYSCDHVIHYSSLDFKETLAWELLPGLHATTPKSYLKCLWHGITANSCALIWCHSVSGTNKFTPSPCQNLQPRREIKNFNEYSIKHQDPFYWNGLISSPAWISNHMPYEVWDEIYHAFSNFNGCTMDVCEWISNFIPDFAMEVIFARI